MEKYETNWELRKQTESLNVNELNPTRKQTESVNVNEHILLEQLPEGENIYLSILKIRRSHSSYHTSLKL